MNWRHSFLITMFLVTTLPVGAADLPSVEVSNIRRVFHDGHHNAFTDLVTFQDKYYLTFRSCPDGHMVHPTSKIVILSSPNARDWKQVYEFSVPLRDTRDPHFLEFKGKLFVYTGTWYSGKTTLPRSEYDLNKHLGYGVWTGDGTQWSEPTQLEGTYGHYVWRAAAFEGRAYLCGRRNHGFSEVKGEGLAVESAMLESEDGLIWRTRTLFQQQRGDETAFLFNPDGAIVGIGRRASARAELLQSKPPYTQWKRTDLDRYVGGPLLVRWGDRFVVGGRKSVGSDGPKTAMYWLQDEKLHEFGILPSAGDNSYPGFVELSPTKAIMSWYSSHEKVDGKQITAIYMADLHISQ